MSEEQLLKKLYYQAFMEQNDNRHPVEVLGEAYVKEQQNKLADLSHIRFAQGEVYFHAKDFETAIFKWENINNELMPWAKKNIADAYFELELFSTAENVYKSITSDSITLNSEVLINQFSLYIHEKNIESAVATIKKAVALNPDYPTVTELAKMFFEEQEDWENALELAVDEAVRTGEMHWADSVIRYIENGLVRSAKPAYFSQLLLIVVSNDMQRFEKLASALWNSFKEGDYYFEWLTQFNNMFDAIGISRGISWHTLSSLYEETYLYLLDGHYLLKEISDIMPGLLINWVKIAEKEHQAFAAAALMTWNELFRSKELNEVVHEAEQILSHSSSSKINLHDSMKLFDSIVSWTVGQGINVSEKLSWIVEGLADLKTQYVLVAGESRNIGPVFIKNLLGDIPAESKGSNVLYVDDQTEEVNVLTDFESQTDFNRVTEFKPKHDRVDIKWSEVKRPNIFLRENGFAFIQAEDIYERNSESLNMADSLMFLVNEKEPFSEKERNLLMKIQQMHPELPLLFLLVKSEEVSGANTENLASMINGFFPDVKISSISLYDTSWGELDELGEFLTEDKYGQAFEQERAKKVLFFVQKMLNQLLEKRVEQENNLAHSVNWNKQMVSKLTGAINQLHDVRSESIRLIKKSYQSEKEGIRNEVIETIPKLLKECSSLVQENSDFGKLHVELNNEMNKRIEEYIMQTALPNFHDSLRRWIDSSSDEFQKTQAYFKELADGFNVMFEEERLDLACDFKIVDDWRRDVIRMTSIVQLEKVNIMRRMTPTQVLLKSAGKLLGGLSQNKKILCSKYKSFIENEDYTEIAESIADKLLMQIELFEKGLERDITMFFTDPEVVLQQLVEDTNSEIISSQTQLDRMSANPEAFNDPLTMFQIRLRQYEWIINGKKEKQYR
jgi:tetratricopeptide (TPR) repeat protein